MYVCICMLATKSSKNLSVRKIKTSHHGMCLKQYLKHRRGVFSFVLVFYGVKATRPSRVVLGPIKHMRRIFWTASKTFLEKRASIDNYTFVNVGNSHTRKTLGNKLICKKIKSHESVLNFLLLTEQGMTSCSRAFLAEWKCRGGQEFNLECYLKSKCSVA